MYTTKQEEDNEKDEQIDQEQGVKGLRQKMNQYELQHMELRNQGLKLVKLNTFEK